MPAEVMWAANGSCGGREQHVFGPGLLGCMPASEGLRGKWRHLHGGEAGSGLRTVLPVGAAALFHDYTSGNGDSCRFCSKIDVLMRGPRPGRRRTACPRSRRCRSRPATTGWHLFRSLRFAMWHCLVVTIPDSVERAFRGAPWRGRHYTVGKGEGGASCVQ